MTKLFQTGYYYYSNTYNLPYPYILNQRKPTSQQIQYYEQFIWNNNLISKHLNNHLKQYKVDTIKIIIQIQILKRWCCNIIQGYVDQYYGYLPNNQMVRYYVISRRSSRKAGTRFYSRGIDDDGNVANYTQTEQLIVYGQYVVSHIQIRGSIPIFFKQIGINGITDELQIERSQKMTMRSFKLHYNNIYKLYKYILSINLLSMNKVQQKGLTQFYEKLIQSSNLEYLKYQYYDFHEQCKNNKFQNSTLLINQLRNIILQFGWNLFNFNSNIIYHQQKGIIRTNCLDCLDRTNYIQSKIALVIFTEVLFLFTQTKTNNKFRVIDPNTQNWNFVEGVNQLWAENGDTISMLYTGIGSTHTDITRTGKRTLMGAVNHKLRSLMRFYTQFTDHRKQEAINNLIGLNRQKRENIRNIKQSQQNITIISIQQKQKINQKQMKEILYEECKIIILFIFKRKKNIINNVQNLWKKTFVFKDQIKNIIKLLQYKGYIEITHCQNYCSYMVVFSKEKEVTYITNVKHETLYLNKLSTDNVILIKLRYYNRTIVFIGFNCTKYSNFINLLNRSHNEAFIENKLGQFRSSSLEEQNYRIIMGNIQSGSQYSKDQLNRLQQKLYKISKLEWIPDLIKLLNCDDYGRETLFQQSTFIQNYNQVPPYFVPRNNRILFWNHQTLFIQVINYEKIKHKQCIYANFMLEISKFQ